MKLLKIEGGLGHFLVNADQYKPVDKVTKEDLLRLVNFTLEGDVAFDLYDEKLIKHHAHQIVYKSIFEKLHGLKERRQEFIDESERLYLKEYEKYRMDLPQQNV